MNRIIRAIYKRLGIIHLGRRKVRDLIDFIQDRQIDVVIDVGGNIGQFAESLRAEGYRGKIVSFEPVESVFNELSKKAAADGNWEAHHCGLGATPGEAVRTAIERTETIRIDTLDRVAAALTGNILLKIDTQGYEKQVIEGGRQTLSKVKGILMELPIIHVYEGEWQFHEAVKFMSDAGFVPAQIQPVGYHGKDKVPRGLVDGPQSTNMNC
jgi:FkbM family methyltransferase